MCSGLWQQCAPETALKNGFGVACCDDDRRAVGVCTAYGDTGPLRVPRKGSLAFTDSTSELRAVREHPQVDSNWQVILKPVMELGSTTAPVRAKREDALLYGSYCRFFA
eukprot:s935_g2.t1